ncbi:MAG: hypothetical protein JXQ99_21155 [Hyphomicrobiaceae bacterium]
MTATAPQIIIEALTATISEQVAATVTATLEPRINEIAESAAMTAVKKAIMADGDTPRAPLLPIKLQETHYDAHQVCEKLDCSRASVGNLQKRGLLNTERLGGYLNIYTRARVDKLAIMMSEGSVCLSVKAREEDPDAIAILDAWEADKGPGSMNLTQTEVDNAISAARSIAKSGKAALKALKKTAT